MTDARALRERVARAIFGPGGLSGGIQEPHLRTATLAIDLVLEEAARVAEGNGLRQYTGLPVIDEIAIAIRALKSGK